MTKQHFTEDDTARYLRRIDVQETEKRAKERGLLDDFPFVQDKEFLNECGYTPDEYLEAAINDRTRKAQKQIWEGVKKQLSLRLKKKEI